MMMITMMMMLMVLQLYFSICSLLLTLSLLQASIVQLVRDSATVSFPLSLYLSHFVCIQHAPVYLYLNSQLPFVALVSVDLNHFYPLAGF